MKVILKVAKQDAKIQDAIEIGEALVKAGYHVVWESLEVQPMTMIVSKE